MKDIKFNYTPDEKGIQRYVEFLKANGVVKIGSVGTFMDNLMYTVYLPGGG
jgi:hypothetical protein